MKLLRTKSLSDNTKHVSTKQKGDLLNIKKFIFTNFILKLDSDNIICNDKKCKIEPFSLMISVAFDTQGKFYVDANTYIDV